MKLKLINSTFTVGREGKASVTRDGVQPVAPLILPHPLGLSGLMSGSFQSLKSMLKSKFKKKVVGQIAVVKELDLGEIHSIEDVKLQSSCALGTESGFPCLLISQYLI